MKTLNKNDWLKVLSTVTIFTLTLLFIYLPFREKKLSKRADQISRFEVLFEEGKNLYNIGFYRDALTKLDSSISLQEFYAPSHYYLGKTYQEIRIIDSALISFQNVLSLDPESYQARIAIAEILIETGNLRMAEKYLYEASIINPYGEEVYILIKAIK